MPDNTIYLGFFIGDQTSEILNGSTELAEVFELRTFPFPTSPVIGRHPLPATLHDIQS